MPIIVPAQLADAPAMHAVQQRAFEEEGRVCGTRDIPPLQETVAGIARHIQDHVALVAREEDRIVGCVRGLLQDGVCTVRALVVEPAWHGKGLGSALIRALEAALHQVHRIELSTNTAMPGNVRFYLRQGYELVGYATPMPGIKLAQFCKLLSANRHPPRSEP